jgi:hypothetical protein
MSGHRVAVDQRHRLGEAHGETLLSRPLGNVLREVRAGLRHGFSVRAAPGCLAALQPGRRLRGGQRGLLATLTPVATSTSKPFPASLCSRWEAARCSSARPPLPSVAPVSTRPGWYRASSTPTTNSVPPSVSRWLHRRRRGSHRHTLYRRLHRRLHCVHRRRRRGRGALATPRTVRNATDDRRPARPLTRLGSRRRSRHPPWVPVCIAGSMASRHWKQPVSRSGPTASWNDRDAA